NDIDETIRVVAGDVEHNEVLVERQSFTQPIQIDRYTPCLDSCIPWTKRSFEISSESYAHIEVSFPSKDGTSVPMFLFGKREIFDRGPCPVIMTAYGGYGIPVAPRFSVLVTLLVEHGCLFALPNIRGGSEFGVEWHNAAKRRQRQTAFDDFVAAAQWLVD